MKKAGIVHFRVGQTDGISLEIDKRKKVLESLGWRVILIGGNKEADIVLKDLNFEKGLAKKVCDNGNMHFIDYKSVDDYKSDFYYLAERVKKSFLEILKKENFDLFLVHNLFSSGRHPPASFALSQICQKRRFPIISTNHDLYWERDYSCSPAFPFIKEIQKEWVLPNFPWIKHVVINSLAGKELYKLHKIKADLMPDSFDFEQPKWRINNFNKDLREKLGIDKDDIFVLQATRIIHRKGIELAEDFVAAFQKKLPEQKVWLVLPNYIEKGGENYAQDLKEKAEELKINFILTLEPLDKKYSFWDFYAQADLITFPSLQEGWGNQFIEAVFAKKPIVVFEYEVFKSDIEPEGYKVISLGDNFKKGKDGLACVPRKNLEKAAKKAIEILNNKKQRKQIVEKNFKIGKKNHSLDKLKLHLEKNIKELLS